MKTVSISILAVAMILMSGISHEEGIPVYRAAGLEKYNSKPKVESQRVQRRSFVHGDRNSSASGPASALPRYPNSRDEAAPSPKSVDTKKFLNDLRSKDVNERVRAATALARAHHIPGVRKALRDPDKRVRRAAVENLSIVPPKGNLRRDEKAILIYQRCLKDKDADVRYAALYKFRSFSTEVSFSRNDMDPDICHVIEPLLYDPSERIRLQAVEEVEKCRIPNIEKELLRIARDKKESTRLRISSIKGLAKSRTKNMDIKIMEFLRPEEYKYIRYAAISALGDLKSKKAVDAIIPYLHDSDSQMRDVAVIALGNIGDPRAAGPLSDILEYNNGWPTGFVLGSLAKAGSPAALPKLLKIKPLLSNSASKRDLIKALGATGSDGAVRPLLDFLRDKDSSVQSAAIQNLERFESRSSLRMITKFLKQQPSTPELAELARKTQRMLDFPEEVKKEKQKKKDYAEFVKKEQELNRIYYSALRLFRKKKYKEAIMMFNDACDKFEKIYASAPEHFVSSFNQIPRIRSILADYYRFKERNIHKAIAEYDKLIPVLDRFSKDQKVAVPYLFMLGEIYEHEVKDYNKSISYYRKALDAIEDQKNVRTGDEKYLYTWFVTWTNFVIDRIRVQEVKSRPNLAPRKLKYPNLDYMVASSFGVYFGSYPDTLFDGDLANDGGNDIGPDIIDKVYHRYAGSYRPLFIGLVFFHELLKENRTDDALVLALKLAGFYPGDLHAVMLYLEVADIYKSRHDQSKYLKYREKGLQAAKALNVDMIIGPDQRFITPESTWHLFVESLKDGKTDVASECFVPSSAAKYQRAFEALKDKLNEIASDMNDIEKVEQDDQTAKFRIIRRENQQEISYGILFINLFGEWKIQNF